MGHNSTHDARPRIIHVGLSEEGILCGRLALRSLSSLRAERREAGRGAVGHLVGSEGFSSREVAGGGEVGRGVCVCHVVL